MAVKKEYERLPGRRWLSFGFARSSLWLGVDHLLLILNRGYSEEYRRFYYSDIQAIQVRQTETGRILNIVFGGLTGLFGLGALASSIPRYDTSALVSGSFGVFFSLFWLINWIKGPTCVCHLRTAVQTEMLAPIHRVSAAKKALARLSPAVESAQGVLSMEQLQALVEPPSSPMFQAIHE